MRLPIFAGAGVIAITMLLVGCSNGVDTPQNQVIDNTAASSSAPAGSAAASLHAGQFTATAPVLKQTTTVAAMDGMTVQAFAKLSLADRYSYALAKSDMAVLQPPTPQDDPALTDIGAIPGFDWYNLMNQGWIHSGSDLGAKIDGGLYYFVVDANGAPDRRYQSDIDTVLGDPGNTYLSTRYMFASAENPTSGSDPSGHPIDYINVTVDVMDYKMDGTSSKQKTQTIQVIRSTVQTLEGTQFIAYTMGFSVDGTGSPEAS
ncbi:hypothetical protein [Subtercola sp. RTI3]|uniref:hypothetical protein n=1 Tax=Subtercola sp. RTI3 TaxID=3048639 RepID=UPI002B23B500|nr:hypothetical protein [Subtercola sp. RTI3]MEA9985652.1 hypothetical protein [Subtercola sp. RTI3]